MFGYKASTVAIRLIRDIEDRVVIFPENAVIHVSREVAAVLVREGIGEIVGPEHAVVAPRETRATG